MSNEPQPTDAELEAAAALAARLREEFRQELAARVRSWSNAELVLHRQEILETVPNGAETTPVLVYTAELLRRGVPGLRVALPCPRSPAAA